MDDTKEAGWLAFALYVFMSILFLGVWLLCWRSGGLAAWIFGPMLLESAEHIILTEIYVLHRGTLDFSSEWKDGEIAAKAAIVGIWLRYAGAPFLSLLVLPLSNGVINVINRRYLAKEEYECVSLPCNVLSTFGGEILGYVLCWIVMLK